MDLNFVLFEPINFNREAASEGGDELNRFVLAHVWVFLAFEGSFES